MHHHSDETAKKSVSGVGDAPKLIHAGAPDVSPAWLGAGDERIAFD
jgi:hypothetical protein